MSDDGAKEWVTVKLPKTVRDQARDDPRTYGEIMQAGIEGTPDFDLEQEALFERLSALEDITGSNNLQREEYREELAEMNERLERIESGVAVVEERTGRLDRRLSEMGGRQ